MVSKLMFMEIFEPEKSKVQKEKILSIKSEIVVFLHISAFRILTFSPALAESSAAQTFYMYDIYRKSSEIFLAGICWIQTNENTNLFV